MKKRSIQNLALNKQSISSFQNSITGGLNSDSKTGGCNTITLIIECPKPEPEPEPEPTPSGN